MSKFLRAGRVIAWNALLLLAGLALFTSGFEIWLRLTRPFEENTIRWKFHPRAGSLFEPNSEFRFTNGLDFWTVSRVNSSGFLDREPIDGKRAAESCHVAVIGDSFVEAKEVPIDEKFHVQLEEIAAENLPNLDVTASAWGLMGTGQIAQSAYYDEFVRRMSPKLVVLVFVPNDFIDNVPLLVSMVTSYDPDRLQHLSAERSEDGSMTLRPPDSEGWRHKLAPPSRPQSGAAASLRLMNWIDAKIAMRPDYDREAALLIYRQKILAERPRYASIIEASGGWLPGNAWLLIGDTTPDVLQYALDFTSFGLDLFKKRADRDGVHLVILSVHEMRKRPGASPFDVLNAMAEERGIPVIDQYDYALRQGVEIRDLHWEHDGHWNALGHRVAAEALAEWLANNRHLCDDGDGSST